VTWDRHRRHEAILKEKIAVIVLERLADPRLGFVTITGVELSRDKRHANVSYTCFGTESQRRTTARALADGAPRVQELLAPTLEMRLIPQLRFVHDEGVEKERRLRELIEGVTAERLARAGPDEPEGGALADDDDDENEHVDSRALTSEEAASWLDGGASLAEREQRQGDDDRAPDEGAPPDRDEPREPS